VEASRVATEADVPRLVELATEALAELAPTRGGAIYSRREARWPPFADRFADEVASPEHLVVVGTIDETAIGYGVVALERLHDGSLLGAVSDLYVDPEARGVGVGEAMMDQIVAWCEKHGCTGVDAVALPGNRHTKNFFETFGLVARAIVVHRPLGSLG
jgi:GNAT superfamily N-acetyltransferase